MIELIDFMMQQFLLSVILNMLFDLILIWRLITLGILSKFHLSIKELHSLPYPVYLKIHLSSFLFLPIFENNESPIICYKYNKSIRSTI